MDRIKLIILLLSFCLTAQSSNHSINEGNKQYFEIKAEKGDGVFKLLRKYALFGYHCNLEAFYKINNLEEKSNLYAGKKYKLPILVYKYNHKSIRSTIGIDDWDLATRIAAYNRITTEKGVRNKNYRDNGILWVPYHELNCATTKTGDAVPEKPVKNVKTLNIPLFGPEHQHVTLKSNDLKGKVYYLISGHGGPDPGALGKYISQSICEDEYAYDVTLRLARNLIEQGATVHMIIQDANDGIRSAKKLDCDTDELCMGKYPIPLNQVSRLSQRSAAVNKLYKKYKKEGVKSQQVIIVHVDSRTAHKRQDVFFYHAKGSNSGKKLAKSLLNTFKAKYKIHRPNGEYHGTVGTRNLYVLRNTLPTAVFVELANIRNAKDQKRIVKEGNRQALADWLYEGLQ